MKSDSTSGGEKGGQQGENVYDMRMYRGKTQDRTRSKYAAPREVTKDGSAKSDGKGNGSCLRLVHDAGRTPHPIALSHQVITRECPTIIQDETLIDALLYVRSALRKIAAECGITSLIVFLGNHDTIIERRQTRFLLDYLDRIEDVSLSPIIHFDDRPNESDSTQQCERCAHHDVMRLYMKGKTAEDRAWAGPRGDREITGVLQRNEPLVTRLAFTRRIIHALTNTAPIITDVNVHMRATDTREELNAAHEALMAMDERTEMEVTPLICLRRGKIPEQNEHRPATRHFIFGAELQGVINRVARMSHDNPIKTRFEDQTRIVTPGSARADSATNSAKRGKTLAEYLRALYRKS